MATINTTEDLLRIVRENEEYRAALRRELLTDDLLALPSEFAEMRATQNEMLETQNEMRATQNEMLETQNRILRDLAETRATQSEMLKTQSEILTTQSEILTTQSEILRRLDNVEAHNRRLSGDFGVFKGNYAEYAAVKRATDIAILLNESKSLGIDETAVRVLSGDDLRALAREYGTEKLATVPLEQRRSFYMADLVMEVPKSDGTTFYIAVEASFTCNGRDTDRALTHAELLTRFTQKETWPVIAGVRVDTQIQSLVDGGHIFWYPLEYRDMEPPELL